VPSVDAVRTLTGLGVALPETVVDTASVEARVGVAPGWIVRRTGIAARRHVGPDERVTDLALHAGRAALADAGLDAAELDAVLVATTLSDHLMPGAAAQVIVGLGAVNAMGWDTNLACSGFLAILEQGAALIESGRAEHVLLIAADALSRLIDLDSPKIGGLFGDGAGAIVLHRGGHLRVGRTLLRIVEDDQMALVVDPHDRTMRMDGHEVFLRACAGMERSCRDLLDAAGLTVGDLDLVIPHQANARITAAVAERLGLSDGQIVDAISEVGNTSAASIPLALDQARRDGRLPSTGLILLTAFGGGFATGAALVELT
jgi:3-oxoacyl-[acyl-carrier-protein] synthase-3